MEKKTSKAMELQGTLKYLFRFRKILFALFLLNLFASLFYLTGPYFSKLYIDHSFLNKDLHSFIQISFLGATVFLASLAFSTVGNIIKNRLKIKVRLTLAGRFVAKLYSQELAFFHNRSTGENIYRLSDAERLSAFILEHIPSLAVNICRFLIVLVIAAMLNLHLTLFLLAASPLFLWQSVYMRKKFIPLYEALWKNNALLMKKVQEAFSKMLIIKAFGWEGVTRRTYLRILLKNVRLGLSMFRWSIISSLSSEFLGKAVFGAISLYGGWLIIKGRGSLGTYTATMIYLTQLGGLIKSLCGGYESLMQDAVSLKRFFEVMERQPALAQAHDAVRLAPAGGSIEFNRVSFGYQDDKAVLQEASFVVPAGSWAAIAGPSGCGKTTLVNLILRLYDPWSGEVLLDGLNLKQVEFKSLREKLAAATQEPFLFDLSLEENIGYGLAHPQQQKIEEAVRVAQLAEFVARLPRGLATPIGENACRLSQGLKQRLALARAIVRNPGLLILDEATSSVDSATEEKIFQELKNLRQGKTTLLVSHRLFSIKDADRIFFLQPGGIMQAGRHEDLLANSAAYRALFSNQLEEARR